MKFISIDELALINQVAIRVKEDTFTDAYKAKVEKQIGSTVDIVYVSNKPGEPKSKCLKYSNVLLIEIEK